MYERLDHHDYKQLSSRTVGDKFYISKDVAICSKDGWLDALHASIGLVTEVQEILLALFKPESVEKVVNMGEEIADAHFYISMLERIYGFDLSGTVPSVSNTSNMNLVIDLIVDSGEILDMYKKQNIYNKPVDTTRLFSKLKQVVLTLESLTCAFGLDTKVIKAKNINKLLVRYPDKFSEINAQVRNLDKEYAALV